MKRVLILLFNLICFGAKSQLVLQPNLGINLGQIFQESSNGEIEGKKPRIGFHVGVDINKSISRSLFFQTGIELESIRRKVENETTINLSSVTRKETYKEKTNIEYLNIPLKIYFKNPALDHGFRAGIGPVIGLGISGRSNANWVVQNTTNTGQTTTETISSNGKIEFGSGVDKYKRLNLSLGLNVSYLFKNRLIAGIYSRIGLTDIDNNSNLKSNIGSSGIIIGYHFSK